MSISSSFSVILLERDKRDKFLENRMCDSEEKIITMVNDGADTVVMLTIND